MVLLANSTKHLRKSNTNSAYNLKKKKKKVEEEDTLGMIYPETKSRQTITDLLQEKKPVSFIDMHTKF